MPGIRDLLPAYRASLVARGRRPSGIRRYLDQLRAFARYLEPDDSVAAITIEAIRRYQENMAARCTMGTVSNALTAIRTFCRWCVREGLRDDDPTLLIEWPRVRKPAPRALRRHEIKHLLEAIAEPEGLNRRPRWLWRRNRLAVLLPLYAGLRVSEVAGLNWRDVDLDAAVLTVRDGKGGKDRSVPLHAVLIDALRQSCPEYGEGAVVSQEDGSPLRVKSAAHIYERWLSRRGVSLSAHQLRHTFASELLRHGADLRSIQELLGHERLETTQRYLMIDSEQLRGAVNLLPDKW